MINNSHDRKELQVLGVRIQTLLMREVFMILTLPVSHSMRTAFSFELAAEIEGRNTNKMPIDLGKEFPSRKKMMLVSIKDVAFSRMKKIA